MLQRWEAVHDLLSQADETMRSVHPRPDRFVFMYFACIENGGHEVSTLEPVDPYILDIQ